MKVQSSRPRCLQYPPHEMPLQRGNPTQAKHSRPQRLCFASYRLICLGDGASSKEDNLAYTRSATFHDISESSKRTIHPLAIGMSKKGNHAPNVLRNCNSPKRAKSRQALINLFHGHARLAIRHIVPRVPGNKTISNCSPSHQSLKVLTHHTCPSLRPRAQWH